MANKKIIHVVIVVLLSLAVFQAQGCLENVKVKGRGQGKRARTGNENGRQTYPDKDSENGDQPEVREFRRGITFNDEPELWVFGIPTAPDLAKNINAAGIRAVVDMRRFNVNKTAAMLAKYNQVDMGFCLTIRWKPAGGKGKQGGKENRKSAKEDVPPTPEESQKSIDGLVKLFNMPAAKAMKGKLWLQLYNEISGGPGRFGEHEEDAMFDYATQLATRVRAEAPHILICGPSLTAVEVLEKEGEAKTRVSVLRKKRLQRSIEWSAKYADAVDLHLHAYSGAWADEVLGITRRALNSQPGGKDTAIVSWEWSCAKMTNRTDKEAVKTELQAIWNAMKKHEVAMAAYAAYWPGQNQKEIYQWKSLVDRNGQPQQPFHSFFTSISNRQQDIRSKSNDQ